MCKLQSPQIAILMATYNGEKYLKDQIESLYAQTVSGWHLYVRDDGSQDATIDIIKSYMANHSNITLIEDKLGGLGTRDQFMRLLKIVDADYFLFCDQDDVWFNDKIEKTLNKMREIEKLFPKDAILIGSDCAMCGPDLEVINPSCWDHLRIDPDKFLTKDGIYCYPFVTGASMILNKKVKEILPPFPNGLPYNRPMYDWWVLINTFKRGHVVLLKEPTRFYRQHNSNVSGGVDKLDTSYYSKIRRYGRVVKANRTRSGVLNILGYSPLRYYFFKQVYLLKMMTYKRKNISWSRKKS